MVGQKVHSRFSLELRQTWMNFLASPIYAFIYRLANIKLFFFFEDTNKPSVNKWKRAIFHIAKMSLMHARYNEQKQTSSTKNKPCWKGWKSVRFKWTEATNPEAESCLVMHCVITRSLKTGYGFKSIDRYQSPLLFRKQIDLIILLIFNIITR